MQQKSYKDVHKTATQDALNLIKQLIPLNQEWIPGKATEGFKTYKKEDKVTGIVYARGEGLIPYTIEQISEVIEDHPNRKLFDELSEQEYVLERFGEKAEIVYSVTKAMYIVISGRDFTLAVDSFIEGDVHYKVAKSIDYPQPPNKDKVRGDIIIAGWSLEPREGGVYCIYIVQVDPKGNIPTKAANLAADVQADVTRNVKKALDKKYNKKLNYQIKKISQ